MNLKTLLVMICVTALVAVGWGKQGMRGMGGNPAANPAALLQRDDVRSDLQLTDDQKSKLYDIQQGLSERFMEAWRMSRNDPDARRKAFENIGKKVGEEVAAILTDGQKQRLREIAIQLAGFASAVMPEVQKSLTLTSDQKNKVADLVARQTSATSEAWEKFNNGEIQMQDVRDAITKNEKILNDEIGKILTTAQKQKLKAIEGKKFVSTSSEAGGGPSLRL